jgi:hypothetical protein
LSPASGTAAAAAGVTGSSVLRGFAHLPLPPLQELQVRPAGQPKARRASAPYQSPPQQLQQLQPLQEQQQAYAAEAAVDRPPSRDGQRQRYRRASAPYQSPTQQLHAAAAADASSGLSGMQE